MSIKFNEVTWYSKLLAIIFLLLVLPVLTFYIGMRYEEAKMLQEADVYIPTISKVRETTPTAVAQNKTYINTKNRFELMYPTNWKVWMTAPGEHAPATGDASIVIVANADETQSFTIDVAGLGSNRLGSYFSSAKNIQEYLKMFTLTDESGKVTGRFVKNVTIDGRPAYWYEVSEWSRQDQKYVWGSRIYFQRGNDIFSIYGVNPEKNDEVNRILNTLKVSE